MSMAARRITLSFPPPGYYNGWPNPFIMPVSRSRHEVLRARLSAFTRLRDKVESGDARAIHRTRVASRRLRELVPVLQLPADECRKLMRWLREATRELGALREPDVLAGLLEALQAELPRPAGRALAPVLSDVHAVRTELHVRAGKRKLGRRLARVAKRLEKAAAHLGAEGPRRDRRWAWAVEARVARRATAVAQAIGDAGAIYLPERLHDVRKTVKKLRYALELQHDLAPQASRSDLARLRRGQELLGTLHDRQMVIDRIRALQASVSEPGERRSRPELDAVLVSLEDDCRRLHGRYLRGRRDLLALCEGLTAWGAPARPGRKRSLRAASGG